MSFLELLSPYLLKINVENKTSSRSELYTLTTAGSLSISPIIQLFISLMLECSSVAKTITWVLDGGFQQAQLIHLFLRQKVETVRMAWKRVN